MKSPYPSGYIGDGVTRCVVLACSAWKAEKLLPPYLELSQQDVSPKGTHPLVLQFHDFSRCRFSLPNLLQPLKFHEQTLGIPFTRIRSRYGIGAESGPYYFMPKLYLDHPWVWTVGRNLWGFDKEMATLEVTRDRYVVTSFTGRQLATLGWYDGEDRAGSEVENGTEFEPIRRMLSQTLISLSPASMGPLLTLTDFDRDWGRGAVRPLRAVLEIDPCYVRGFDGGQFRTNGARAREDSVICSYEISAQWWLSFPYLPRA